MHPQKRKNDGTAKDCDGVWQLAAARWGSTIPCRSRTRRRGCVEGVGYLQLPPTARGGGGLPRGERSGWPDSCRHGAIFQSAREQMGGRRNSDENLAGAPV